MNPLTSETRDQVLSVNLAGFCTKLRAPESLRALLRMKPDHVGLGDHLLKAALDAHLMALIVGGRYRELQTTLAALFGAPGYEPVGEATGVVGSYERSQNGSGR